MKKNNILPLLLITISFLFLGCDEKEEKFISFKQRELIQEKKEPKEQTLKISIGAIITPKEGVVYYQHLLDYLSLKTGINIERIDKKSYSEINNMLKKNEVDAGFVCSGPYVEGAKKFGLELLVVPQAYGKTTYNSYILVNHNSTVEHIEELKGKSFAFTDPKSNTGKVVPTYMLAKIGETPKEFFKSYTFTYGHDKSIQAVAQNIVDGAAVDSLVWEYMNLKDPQYTSKTKILIKSDPYGIPPVVIRKGIDRKIKDSLRKTFLEMHKDKKGKDILEHMMIDKFVEAEDKSYNSIRDMQEFIESNK